MTVSERILLSYITIRGADLESLCQTIKEKKIASFDFLAELFAMPDKTTSTLQVAQLRDCVNFLRSLGILKTGKLKRTDEFVLASDLQEMPFQLILLSKLRSARDKSFYQVHTHLVSKDVLLFDLNQLKQSVEKSIDLGFAWTEEKLNFWMDLAEFVGLGRRYSLTRSFVCYPSPVLLLELMKIFTAEKTKPASLKAFANHVSSNFFECFTQQKMLSEGLQQSLLFLESRERISLIPAPSDDPSPVTIRDKPFGTFRLREVAHGL